jgi:cob(I)alamin adenosyltransferase
MEFESITTKAGDKGFTSLLDGKRIHKTSQTIKTLGEIDSLNAFLGMVRSNENIKKYDKKVIQKIQEHLYKIMGILSGFDTPFSIEYLNFIEKKQKVYMKAFNTPNVFINFGEQKEAALFNLCRTQTRKAEIAYIELKNPHEYILSYFNRLSDLLYAISIFYEYNGKNNIFNRIFRIH